MQPAIESKLNTTFETFEATTYTQQIVAGKVYHVRIVTENPSCPVLHVRIYQSLPHTQKGPEVQAIKIASDDEMLTALPPDEAITGRARFMTA